MSNSTIPQVQADVKGQMRTVKQVVVGVKFWWETWDPEKAFDYLEADGVRLEARSTDATLQAWQPARPGATLLEVFDWMLDRGLKVLGYEMLKQRRTGRHWEGLFLVKIGKEIKV